MKIELHHLKKFPFYQDTHSYGLVVLFDEFVFLPVSDDNLDYVIERQLKPALRPLSDLSKSFLDGHLQDLELRDELEALMADEIELHQLSTASTQFMQNNLFDIDGLLDEGLAIDFKFKSLERVQKKILEDDEERKTDQKAANS